MRRATNSRPASAGSAHPFRFRKSERLSGKAAIQRLFADGRRHYHRGLTFIYASAPDAAGVSSGRTPAPAQVLMTVPKRKFRKAAIRNRLRRQLKEAYRLEKHTLYGALRAADTHLHLAIISHRTANPDFQELRSTLRQNLGRIAEGVTAGDAAADSPA
jgi:ribonuclease P protein component